MALRDILHNLAILRASYITWLWIGTAVYVSPAQVYSIEVYYIVNKMKQTSMLFLRHFASERNMVCLKKFHQIYAQCLDVSPPCNV